MNNLTPVILFLMAFNQKVLSRRLQNAIDDNLYYAESYFVKPYSSNGAAPQYKNWRLEDYDAYSDENEDNHRIIFPDVDWSDEIPSWTAQTKIRQCIASCQPSTEYQPVCGTDGVTYNNLEHMQCFMSCGVDIHIRQMSPCPGWSGTTVSPIQPPKTTTAAAPALNTIQQQQQACMSSCPTTPEYNPVCGSDHVTYNNHGKLTCAQLCGKDVQLLRRSPCPKIKSTLETVSTPRSATLDNVRTCMVSCPTDPQYDPVCGTNKETFYNLSRLKCAINCGVDVSLLKSVPCHIEVNSNTDDNKGNDQDYDIDIRFKNS